MPAADFLRDYWQKKPLLIRNALPGFVSPIEPEDLAGLACEDAALSRLVRHDRERDAWTVRHGPFREEEFPGLGDRDWTLLVQDVDKWDADIAALLPKFDFLPRWRIDDVMVSFAATGGSVGAHVDQYDVFLLQALGHRRWQVDTRDDPPLHFRKDAEIRLLQRFTPSHDWVLAPGDMLYLPPGVPHHGVAEDPCLTFSIGMRAPWSAARGGAVAATVERYDGFRLPAIGHRRWQVDTRDYPPLPFRKDAEIRLRQLFTPSHDWVLAPGDMLYLPPGVPHHGVAEDPCLTFSIGMRAPSSAELLGDFVDTLAAEADDGQRYVDPALAPAKDPNEIDAAARQRMLEALNALRMNAHDRIGDRSEEHPSELKSLMRLSYT